MTLGMQVVGHTAGAVGSGSFWRIPQGASLSQLVYRRRRVLQRLVQQAARLRRKPQPGVLVRARRQDILHRRLLAMRVGKAISFVGSVAALGLMTVISVGIGCAFAQVPQFVNSTLPIQQYAGAALLAYFGAVLAEHFPCFRCRRPRRQTCRV